MRRGVPPVELRLLRREVGDDMFAVRCANVSERETVDSQDRGGVPREIARTRRVERVN